MKDIFVAYDKFITDSELFIHLDPGHGGIVNGEYTTAPAKMFDHGSFTFYEGVFNRAMALQISEKLMENGISHAFTTDSNYDASLPLRTTRANSLQRLYKDKKHLYISIHGNAAGTNNASGIEVFTSPGDTGADVYATNIYNSLNGMGWKMRSDYSDGDPDKEERFYVLVYTKMPAVLVEYGFFTNREQAILMMEPRVQEDLARMTVEGVLV